MFKKIVLIINLFFLILIRSMGLFSTEDSTNIRENIQYSDLTIEPKQFDFTEYQFEKITNGYYNKIKENSDFKIEFYDKISPNESFYDNHCIVIKPNVEKMIGNSVFVDDNNY